MTEESVSLQRDTPSSVAIEMDAKYVAKIAVKEYCASGELMEACQRVLEAYDFMLQAFGHAAREPRQ